MIYVPKYFIRFFISLQKKKMSDFFVCVKISAFKKNRTNVYKLAYRYLGYLLPLSNMDYVICLLHLNSSMKFFYQRRCRHLYIKEGNLFVLFIYHADISQTWVMYALGTIGKPLSLKF